MAKTGLGKKHIYIKQFFLTVQVLRKFYVPFNVFFINDPLPATRREL